MQHFGDVMFTDSVKAEQVRMGSRVVYEQMTARPVPEGLDEMAQEFVESRDSFYMATVTETGWPYVQHRGGPVGFVKVLAPATLGFADYRGNRQYISKGNLSTDDRVALFLMDYPQQARLKIAGHARVIDAKDDPVLAERLSTAGKGRVERLVTIDVEAFDWNCPQFITPRFSETQVLELFEQKHAALLEENAALRARLEGLEST